MAGIVVGSAIAGAVAGSKVSAGNMSEGDAKGQHAGQAARAEFGRKDTGVVLLGALVVISIEAMQVLPITESARVFAWLRALNYPWSSAERALRSIPGNELLSPIAQFLRQHVAVVL